MSSGNIYRPMIAVMGLCLNLTAFGSQPSETPEDGIAAWRVSVGAVTVQPSATTRVNRGTPAEGTVQFQSGEALAISGTYSLDQHWAINLWITAPANSSLKYSAGLSSLTVARLKLQQSALSVRYHLERGRLASYAGLGLNLSRFSNETFTLVAQGPQSLQLQKSLGVAAQIGADLSVGRHGFINAEARFAESDPTAFVDGTRLQTLRLDPWDVGLYAGWRF